MTKTEPNLDTFLYKAVNTQQETITYLTNRVSQLVDELSVLKSEVNTFKEHVANDMNRVVKTLQTKG
jgi:archaellum component FlaC